MLTDRAYRPDIDGLRAIAVLSVLVFHADLGLPGGFVGVDVFFVISGYLITGILLRELSDGEFTAAKFWSRRIRRILPASILVTVSTLLACGFVMMPDAFEETAKSALAHSVACANFYFWKVLGYFEERGETRPLLHMWSLAVEEQFYLCFPALIAIGWRQGRRAVWLILISMWLMSFMGSIAGLQIARSSTFYLLPGRAWELCTGAILAMGEFQSKAPPNQQPGFWRKSAAIAGTGLIASACLGYSRQTPFPAAYALPPCVGTALLIWSQSVGLTAAGRMMASPPMRLIGKMSYSLYLWHWPMLALLRYGIRAELSAVTSICALAATFGFSFVTWRYVEIPFRTSKRTVTTPCRTVLAGIGASAIMAGIAGLVLLYAGLPQRLPPKVANIGAGTVAWADAPTIPSGFKGDVNSLPSVGSLHATHAAPDVVLWGDSHAGVISPLLDRLGKSEGRRFAVAIMNGVVPLEGVWSNVGQDGRTSAAVGEVLAAIERVRPFRVILAARWSMHLERATDVSRRDPTEVMQSALRRTVDRLRSAGVREIVICAEVPRQELTPPQIAIRFWWFGLDPTRVGVSRDEHARRQAESRRLMEFAASLDGVRVVDLGAVCVDEQGIARAQDSHGALYTDDNHLDLRGATRYLFDVVRTLVKTSG